MAEKPICPNCGSPQERQWLLCKFCHRPRWNMILRYYLGAALFLGLPRLLIALNASGANNPLFLLLTRFGVFFSIIGTLFLLAAFIATVRGLFAKKIPASLHTQNTSDWQKPIANSSTVFETSHSGTTSTVPVSPAAEALSASPELEVADLTEQVIFCQKCNHRNIPTAINCSQCGANLLPGTGVGLRMGFFIASILLGLLSLSGAYLYFRNNLAWSPADLIIISALVLLGLSMLIIGIYNSLRKTPLFERYENRAVRHASLNPLQAIADFSSAIATAPPERALNDELSRAKMLEKLGKTADARAEWQRALENINKRVGLPNASVELIKQRAEIYNNMGMKDDYATQMLRYTIEKQRIITARSHGEMGFEEGLRQGVENSKLEELSTIRAQIMANPRYKIVGQCWDCRDVVDLSARLRCTNNPKHRKITDIHPILSESTQSIS